jgi:hypothetical protein
MDGRRRRSAGVLGAWVLALVASGCGSSSRPPTVQVSLKAPTDGATVVESRVFVTGSVQPADSKLVIAGRAAPNHHGRFGVWMPLRRGVTHIRISARAPGYIADATVVAVRSTPRPVRKHKPVQPLLLSVNPSVSGWTPAVRTAAANECVVRGGWQSYCECALRYAMAAGSPRQVAYGVLAARSQLRLPYWIKQTVVHCL